MKHYAHPASVTALLIKKGLLKDVGFRELKGIAEGNLEWTEKGLEVQQEAQENFDKTNKK